MLGKIKLSVTFRHIEHSSDLVAIVENEARALHRRHPEIQSCTVMIEERHRRHRTGNAVRARVSIEVPGKVLVSAKKSHNPDASAGAPAAVYHAFDAVEHALGAYQSRHRARHHGHHARLRTALAAG